MTSPRKAPTILSRRFAVSSVFFTAVFLGALCYPLWRRLSPERPVSVRTLWKDRGHWLDRLVLCRGKLLVFSSRTSSRYFVLEEAGYRLQILGVPRAELAPLAGQDVLACGRFKFKKNVGVYLLTDRIVRARRNTDFKKIK